MDEVIDQRERGSAGTRIATTDGGEIAESSCDLN
jgi:hypothetical protein